MLGIKSNILALFQDYLTGRQQLTNIGGILSSIDTLSHEVPQGSILGPALFNVYMNNLPSIFKSMTIRMYADDAVLFKELDLSNDVDGQIEGINSDLNLLGEWCMCNKLTINVDKSKSMLFIAPLSKYCHLDLNESPDLYLNGTKLGYVKSYRYLGLELDDQDGSPPK